MKEGYAKLLGLSSQVSDSEILLMLESGSHEIAGKKVEMARPSAVHTGFGDPFIGDPNKRIRGQ